MSPFGRVARSGEGRFRLRSAAAVVVVVCLVVGVLAQVAGAHNESAGGGSGVDVGVLARLVGEQEALLNAYRCMFSVDVEVVPGGCEGGVQAVSDGELVSSVGGDVGSLARLVGEQEALLNAYRCLFSVDVEVVPGGCMGGALGVVSGGAEDPAEDLGQALRPACSAPERCLVSIDARGGFGRWCGLKQDQTLLCTQRYGFGPFLPGRFGPPEGRFLSISAGYTNSCGVREDRTVECWNEIGWYVIGNRGLFESDMPSGRFLSVSAGIGLTEFSCGVSEDRTAVCWGDSEFDRTGRLDAPEGRFLSVSAGWEHACGIQEDRTVVCWGDNKHGRLEAPAGRFKSVSAGFWFSCGIRDDDTATCWGNNLKRGYNAPGGRFIDVSAGQGLACGLREDSTAVCWGPPHAGGFGELDPPGGRFVSVSAGPLAGCGLRLDGTPECWGKVLQTAWPDLAPEPVQAVYAIPAGVEPVAGRVQLIADAIAEVQAWFRDQTGGRHLRFARDGDGILIVVVNLSDAGADTDDVMAEIYEQLGKRGPLAVFGEGEFDAASVPYESGGHSCAHGGRDAVMISMPRCVDQYSSTRLTGLVAHELVHMLGAVPRCAPNHDGSHHLITYYSSEEERAAAGDGTDIMDSWVGIVPLSQAVLDKGRDDYFMHGRDDCWDIAANPLLAYPDP